MLQNAVFAKNVYLESKRGQTIGIKHGPIILQPETGHVIQCVDI